MSRAIKATPRLISFLTCAIAGLPLVLAGQWCGIWGGMAAAKSRVQHETLTGVQFCGKLRSQQFSSAYEKIKG